MMTGSVFYVCFCPFCTAVCTACAHCHVAHHVLAFWAACTLHIFVLVAPALVFALAPLVLRGTGGIVAYNATLGATSLVALVVLVVLVVVLVVALVTLFL